MVASLIRICRIECWCSLFWFLTGNALFGQIWFKKWPRFRDICTWSLHQKNLFLTPRYLHKNFMCHIVAVMVHACFRIVTHRYAALFSRKVILCETKNIYCSLGNCIWHTMNNIFWNYIKNKGEVPLDSFRNFAYVSSYLRLKGFGWKRDYVIFQKVLMPKTSWWPF